jgi:hypothetical protein
MWIELLRNKRMSERLDQIERLVESNARAILALTNQGVELNTKIVGEAYRR